MSGVDVIAPFTGPAELPSLNVRLPALFLPDPKSSERFWEFLAANIRNKNTRRAYYKPACRFNDWCEGRGAVRSREDKADSCRCIYRRSAEDALQAYGEAASGRIANAFRLAGGRPHYRSESGGCGARSQACGEESKTPVLTADEARLLLDSIDTSSLIGLRHRALIAVMTYTFARVGAAVQMKVEDYFIQGRRGWLLLHEKGGKRHDVSAHHNLDEYIEAYMKVAGLQGDPKGFLFRTVAGKTGRLTALPLSQADDSQAGARCRDSDENREPFIPGNGHHGVS